MQADQHNRLLSANRELHSCLERMDALVHGKSDIGADELRALGQLLEATTPEVSEAKRNVPVDAVVQSQVQEYIGNLRALQVSLEQVRCVMLARRADLDVARQHIQGLQGWVDAYRQTT